MDINRDVWQFLYFIVIVWGILNIILFFKIWGMTNDVKAIKDRFLYGNSQINVDSHKFKKGDFVIYKDTKETLVIIDTYKDSTYSCLNPKTGKTVGIISEDKLILKE